MATKCTYLLIYIYLHPVATCYQTGIKLLVIFYLQPFSAKVPAYATAKILAIDTEALAGVNTNHLRGECKFLASKTDALVTLQMSCTVPTVVS